jgi:hypothetical protein
MGKEVAPCLSIFSVSSHPKHDRVHGPIGELGLRQMVYSSILFGTGRHVRKKLNRTMVDVDWQLGFHHALTEILPQHDSDNNPLLISCSKFKRQCSKKFHFQAAWIAHPNYEELVDNTWNAYGPFATAKLANIKEKSINFNKEVFRNIFKRKRQVEAHIKGVHRQLDIYASSDIIRLEFELEKQLSTISKEDE